MHHVPLDTSTRRASLVALATAGLTGLAHAGDADAKKHKRKRRKRNNGDANNLRLCKKQVGQCLDLFIPPCEDDLVCQVQIESCCSALGSCDLDGFFVCIADAGSNTARAHAALLP